MMIGLVLLLIGVALIVVNPLLGLIPGVILVVLGLVLFVLGGLGRGVGAVLSFGSTKTCPDCRTEIPAQANVCRYCGYRYGERA